MNRNFHEHMTNVRIHSNEKFQEQEYQLGSRQRTTGLWNGTGAKMVLGVLLAAIAAVIWILVR